MKHLTTLLAVCGALALSAGCVGDLEPVGPGDTVTPTAPDAGASTDPTAPNDTDTAEALFMGGVHSVIQGTCGIGTACHTTTAPTFAVQDAMTSYQAVLNNIAVLAPNFEIGPQTLLIENGRNGAHYGNYPDGDIPVIENWLRAEKDKDGGVVQTSPLQTWSGCMDYTEFEASNVADEWADKNAQGQGNCDACHNLGAEAAMFSNQDQRVFDNITTNPTLMLTYFTLSDDGSDVVINRARLEKVGNQLPPHQAHGGFEVDGNAYDALLAFYNQTHLRFAAGTCGPPRF